VIGEPFDEGCVHTICTPPVLASIDVVTVVIALGGCAAKTESTLEKSPAPHLL
jgi:hypothetical protein